MNDQECIQNNSCKNCGGSLERFTVDSHYSDNIYTFLQKNGICSFYSEKVAKEYAGEDYEALILYALSRTSSLFNLFPLTFTLSAAIFQTVLTLALGFGFTGVHAFIEDSM